ncbi:MAG TPA: acetyl-CoA carboxylase biotin carboxyl carrier protein [Pyrinomonadaceae bacterium]|jgi:acetyl-CoA carboxylase biotin carboxyl carrier protein
MSEQETQHPSSEDRSPKPNREERHERGGGRDRGRRRHQPQQQQQPRRPEATLNVEELRELVELIAQHGFTDFELEREGIRVRLRRELAPQIIAAAAPPPTTGAALAPPPPPPVNTSPSSAPPAASAAETSVSASAAAVGPSAAEPAEAGEDEGLHIITSPIVGTFYRAPSPTTEPFVRLGTHVDPDMVVCIIEAMKLMNEIQAETSGEVVKIYVENGQPVEYGQPLFGIKR